MAIWSRNKLYGGNDTDESGDPLDSFVEGADDPNSNDPSVYLNKLKISPAANSTGLTRGKWLKTLLYQTFNSFVHKEEDRDIITGKVASTIPKYVAKDQLPEVVVDVDDMTDGTDASGSISMFELVDDTSATTFVRKKLSFSAVGLTWLKARTWLGTEIDNKITAVTGPMQTTLNGLTGATPVVPGERYSCSDVSTNKLNFTGLYTDWGTLITATVPLNMSYKKGNRIRFQSTDGTISQWWEGIVVSYTGTTLIVKFDKSENIVTENNVWSLGLGAGELQKGVFLGWYMNSGSWISSNQSYVTKTVAIGTNYILSLPAVDDYRNSTPIAYGSNTSVGGLTVLPHTSDIPSGSKVIDNILIPRNDYYKIEGFMDWGATGESSVNNQSYSIAFRLGVFKQSAPTVLTEINEYIWYGPSATNATGLISTGDSIIPSKNFIGSNVDGYRLHLSGTHQLGFGDKVVVFFYIPPGGPSINKFNLTILRSSLYLSVVDNPSTYKQTS